MAGNVDISPGNAGVRPGGSKAALPAAGSFPCLRCFHEHLDRCFRCHMEMDVRSERGLCEIGRALKQSAGIEMYTEGLCLICA